MEKSSLEIRISGMDCAECAAHVQKSLSSLKGVTDARVYLGAEKAVIQFVDKPPSEELIRQSVKDAGYQAHFDQPGQSASSTGLMKAGRSSIVLFVMIILLVLATVIIGEQFGVLSRLQEVFPWYGWAAIVILGGWPIFVNVWKSLLKKRIISHTLMTASTLAAILVGEWATAVLIVIFMRLGNFIEQQTTEKARQAVRELYQLAPQTAHLILNGAEQDVEITSLKAGDVVLVKPGESIPVDGTVIEGSASVDQSAITGESIPLGISSGQSVFAASILQTGMLKVRTTGVGRESLFGRVIQMVEEAEANRGEVQQIADKFSGYYLPIVAAIAALTYLVSRNALAAAAVMAVACSCSFSLATPVAMLASIGSAAKNGLLFKGGKYVESLEKINTIFLDKTGTLTLGKPEITQIKLLDDFSEDDIVQLSASVERYSEHPLAQAVIDAAGQRGLHFLDISEFESIPGQGVKAQVGNLAVEIRSTPLPHNNTDSEIIHHMETSGLTLLYIHINSALSAILGAEDVLRDDVKQSIGLLKEQGIKDITLISGDKQAAVQKVADFLGINFQAELQPQDKIRLIKNAQQNGKRVLMVGDGINDAPSLAQADIGIAMGASGSQIAIETSHIVLLREDWQLIPYAFEVARRTMRIVRANIAFTALYNLFGLAIAAVGFLPPAIAASMQSIPDIGIMANSARLLRNTNKKNN